MKHILNNLTDEEKQEILEQHSITTKVMNEDISNMKYLFDYKPGMVISEQKTPNSSEEIFRARQEHAYDKNQHFSQTINDKTVFVSNGNAETVKNALRQITDTTKSVGLMDCEYADFSDIEICNRPNLDVVIIKRTENNFKEHHWECIDIDSEEDMYFITNQYSLFKL
jgi:hypothetical protein